MGDRPVARRLHTQGSTSTEQIRTDSHIESNEEPIWKGMELIDCLRKQNSTDFAEEEMLGDLKLGGRICSEIQNWP
jgi:hypothetical protein